MINSNEPYFGQACIDGIKIYGMVYPDDFGGEWAEVQCEPDALAPALHDKGEQYDGCNLICFRVPMGQYARIPMVKIPPYL